LNKAGVVPNMSGKIIVRAPKIQGPRLAVLAATAALSMQAWAQSSPYYFGGGLGLTHVSNVYRQANDANSDNVTTATLLAGVDQRFGRQRLFGDGSVQSNRYQSNSSLNNQSYSVRGGLDWETLERLSGTLSGNASRAAAFSQRSTRSSKTTSASMPSLVSVWSHVIRSKQALACAAVASVQLNTPDWNWIKTAIPWALSTGRAPVCVWALQAV